MGRKTEFFGGRGVPPGRPDASARRPYLVNEEFCRAPGIVEGRGFCSTCLILADYSAN